MSTAEAHALWYREPARTWEQALPIGTGRLGAMVFGGVRRERLQLNDITVWSGGPQPEADRADAHRHLPRLRRLIRDRRYAEAEVEALEHCTPAADYSASYQTLGDLRIDLRLPDGEPVDYRRALDLDDAVATTVFSVGGTRFEREAFASAAHGCVVLRLAADRPAAVSARFGLSRVERAATRVEDGRTLVMTGDTGGALRFEVRARVVASGGVLREGDGGAVLVEGADEVLLLLSSATTYALDPAAGYSGGDLGVARRAVDAAAAVPPADLRAAHVAEHRGWSDRVALALGPHDGGLPTDERLRAYAVAPSPAFVELFHRYGRYLLIASSRPNNPLPSNSQGLWGDGLDLPWKCDYKANINVEMNYWAVESANLAELHRPMLRLAESVVGPGGRTARSYFGPTTPGWVMAYTTNAWGWTSPGAGATWGIWFGGSAWLCRHLWEHYAYSRDLGFLRQAYPVMRGAAEFWLDQLVETDDGHLVPSPSSSPENTFRTEDGTVAALTEGATMERSLVRDLLRNTAFAADATGEPDFAALLRRTRDRIRPPRIGRFGQVMEWDRDWDDPEDRHRHVSHLFALHPGDEITVRGAPELAEAARVTLEHRGDDGTGWSLAWKINLWARLHDGDRALALIAKQFRFTEETDVVMADAGGTYPNLLDAHPPFQIDGNLGFVSGVDEMLLQSHERYLDERSPLADRYVVELLPALPRAWPVGSVRGLRARGGFEVDLAWSAGRLESAVLRSPTGGTGRLRCAGHEVELHLAPGGQIRFDGLLRQEPAG